MAIFKTVAGIPTKHSVFVGPAEIAHPKAQERVTSKCKSWASWRKSRKGASLGRYIAILLISLGNKRVENKRIVMKFDENLLLSQKVIAIRCQCVVFLLSMFQGSER